MVTNYTYGTVQELGTAKFEFKIDPKTKSTVISGTIVQEANFKKFFVRKFSKIYWT